jgi:hypothetical protein
MLLVIALATFGVIKKYQALPSPPQFTFETDALTGIHNKDDWNQMHMMLESAGITGVSIGHIKIGPEEKMSCAIFIEYKDKPDECIGRIFEGQIFWEEETETLYIWDEGWIKIGKGEESDARK